MSLTLKNEPEKANFVIDKKKRAISDINDIFVGDGGLFTRAEAQLFVTSQDMLAKNPKLRKFISEKTQIHTMLPKEEKMYVSLQSRASHGHYVGTTGCGKTVALTSAVMGDIDKFRTVIYIDPKGDFDMMKNIVAMCKHKNRMDDLYIVHSEQPDISAKIDLFGDANSGQIAERLTATLEESPYTSAVRLAIATTVKGILGIGEHVNPSSLGIYIRSPELLFVNFCKKHFENDKQFIADSEAEIRNYVNDEKTKIAKSEFELEAFKTVVRKRKMLDTNGDTKIKSVELDKKVEYNLLSALGNLEHRELMISNIFSVFETLNGSESSKLFNYEERDLKNRLSVVKIDENGKKHLESPLVHKLKTINFKNILLPKNTNKIVYIGLSALSNPTTSSVILKSILSDLASVAGHLYGNKLQAGIPEVPNAYIYIDEAKETASAELIQLLNKARGAGFRICWATQSYTDLIKPLGSKDEADTFIANSCGYKVIMRVEDYDTAKKICDGLADITVFTTLASTGTMESEIEHRTTNSDTLVEKVTKLITPDQILALPTGHAFVILSDNTVYKTRFPILFSDGENDVTDLKYYPDIEVEDCDGNVKLADESWSDESKKGYGELRRLMIYSNFQELKSQKWKTPAMLEKEKQDSDNATNDDRSKRQISIDDIIKNNNIDELKDGTVKVLLSIHTINTELNTLAISLQGKNKKIPFTLPINKNKEFVNKILTGCDIKDNKIDKDNDKFIVTAVFKSEGKDNKVKLVLEDIKDFQGVAIENNTPEVQVSEEARKEFEVVYFQAGSHAVTKELVSDKFIENYYDFDDAMEFLEFKQLLKNHDEYDKYFPKKT